MLLNLIVPMALAQPPASPSGFASTKSGDSCTVYVSAPDAQGVSNIWVGCSWPDRSPQRLDQLLTPFDRHDDYFSAIESATCQSMQGGQRCIQVNVATGISDRQVELWMERVDQGDKKVYRFAPVSDPSPTADGRVQARDASGAWTVWSDGAGGSHVTYELRYDPGGSVPGWIVRWFQSSGILTLVEELYAQG